jgi:hypothetical protein
MACIHAPTCTCMPQPEPATPDAAGPTGTQPLLCSCGIAVTVSVHPLCTFVCSALPNISALHEPFTTTSTSQSTLHSIHMYSRLRLRASSQLHLVAISTRYNIMRPAGADHHHLASAVLSPSHTPLAYAHASFGAGLSVALTVRRLASPAHCALQHVHCHAQAQRRNVSLQTADTPAAAAASCS